MESNTHNVDQMEVNYPMGEDALYPGDEITASSVENEKLLADSESSIELEIEIESDVAEELNIDEVEIDDGAIEVEAASLSDSDLELKSENSFELELEIEIDPVMAAELDIGEVEILDDEMDGLEDQFNLELDYFDVEQQEEKLWQARTGLNRETLCGAIETVIFMSDKPVSISRIKTLIDEDMPLRVIHESIEKLQEEYELKHHGLRLVEVADGYQYRTKATYSKYVQDLFKVHSLVLSPTALEVLSIIAYKQPVSRIEVEKIRGVDSSHIVRALMDKRLVKVSGRSEELGRPVLYSTTPEFLEVFNLANIEDLPPESELEEMSHVNVGKIGDIRTIVQDGDKKSFFFDEVDELEKLSDDIKAINAETDFIQSLKVEEKKRIGNSGAEVKSAFELLEEHLDQALVKEFNSTAAASELFTAITMPDVISDLTAGPFNVPEEEEDSFEMIDLDTGEAIIVDNASEDEEDEILFNLDGDESPEEVAQSLSDALDKAFENLTGDSLDAVSLDSLASTDDIGSLGEKELKIEEVTEGIMSKAEELDIDLSFLGENDGEVVETAEKFEIDLSFLNENNEKSTQGEQDID